MTQSKSLVISHQNMIYNMISDIILCMLPANERWRCNVTSSLIGWLHKQNDPWIRYICYDIIYERYEVWDMIWCGMVWCDMTWCDVMWCDVMWCDVMWCDMIWYMIMIYETMLHTAQQWFRWNIPQTLNSQSCPKPHHHEYFKRKGTVFQHVCTVSQQR